jgi:hypothetical protein
LNKRRTRSLRFAGLTALAVAGSALVPLQMVSAEVVVHTRADEVCGPVSGSQVRKLAFPASHVALHWDGNPDAVVKLRVSADGKSFGEATPMDLDEVGEQRHDGRTYAAVQALDTDAVAVTVESDRTIGRLCVLAMADGARTVERRVMPAGKPASGTVAQPTIKSRTDWGADETLRFKGATEIWPPEFYPVTNLIVHHTATKNRDRDPKATIRSIYRYHTVTQGWGDIGYNFLIDEAGNVYKGRYSHDEGATADNITGNNSVGKGVRAGHAYGFNAGTVGVALLGTLTSVDATSAAKTSLEKFLAWEASSRPNPKDPTVTLDPTGTYDYVSPVDPTYSKQALPTIAGHLDVNSTECPGGAFYKGLPTIRTNVKRLVSPTAP